MENYYARKTNQTVTEWENDMVTKDWGFVTGIVHGMIKTTRNMLGVDMEDIESHAMIYYLKALRSFDYSKEAGFRTYATHVIQNGVRDFVIKEKRSSFMETPTVFTDCVEAGDDYSDVSAGTNATTLVPEEPHDYIKEISLQMDCEPIINKLVELSRSKKKIYRAGAQAILTQLEGHSISKSAEFVDLGCTYEEWLVSDTKKLLDKKREKKKLEWETAKTNFENGAITEKEYQKARTKYENFYRAYCVDDETAFNTWKYDYIRASRTKVVKTLAEDDDVCKLRETYMLGASRKKQASA